jgi:hypothetical protein
LAAIAGAKDEVLDLKDSKWMTGSESWPQVLLYVFV